MVGSRRVPNEMDSVGKRHDIVRGRVWCQIQGDVDVELCFYCPFTEAIDMDSPVKTITCIPNMAMSVEDRIAYQRLGVLKLAETIGNVSRVCRERGISRTQFYKYKDRYEEQGLQGLRDSPALRGRLGRGITPSVADRIVELNLAHPALGCARISEMLQSQGMDVTPVGVQNTLTRCGLGTKYKRLLRLQEQAVLEGRDLSAEQVADIERMNPAFRERQHESTRPGEVLAQDTLYVGQMRGLGKVYLQTVVDTYGSYAFGYLHTGKLPKYAVAILQNDVLRFYKRRDIQICAIITDNGREYCGTSSHPYEYYLELNEIEHRKTAVHSHLINGFVEAFDQIVLDEFFRDAFQDRSYDNLQALQRDLDEWLVYYNTERACLGYRTLGKRPIETIVDHLARRCVENL